MLSALCWVPRGAARPVPEYAQPTEEEIAAARQQAEHDVDAAVTGDAAGDEELDSESDDEHDQVAHARAVADQALQASRNAGQPNAANAPTDALEAAMRELDMEHYDDEDDEDREGMLAQILADTNKLQAKDPYGGAEEEDEEDSERENLEIKPTDLLLVAAKNEEDCSSLEIWLYEEAGPDGEANIYVHHDLLLPAFALCVCWLDMNPQRAAERSNMVAVGTFDPGIEVWDLDVLDDLEPAVVLGGPKSSSKKSSRPKLVEGSHTDAVMSLAWNAQYRNVLASGSADKTIKVWDVSAAKCERSVQHHDDKVQALTWHHSEASVLLSGGYDKRAVLTDMRQATATAASWKLTADIEAVCWDLADPTVFLVSTEAGMVVAFDTRKGAESAPLFQLAAHDKPATSICLCPAAPKLMATSSIEGKVKLWDLTNNAPTQLHTQDLHVGAVFCAAFNANNPALLAAGGEEGGATVWDVRSVDSVVERFPTLSSQQST